MKPFVLLVLAAVLLIVVEYPENSGSKVGKIERFLPSELEEMEKVELGEMVYSFVWFRVDNPADLDLIGNFEQQVSSDKLVETYGCQLLVNGGFYGKDERPIGWFKTEDKVISLSEKNSLFNGYISVSKNNKVAVSRVFPGSESRIGLQSGPVLILDGRLQKLEIKNDEARRRAVAAVTNEGKIVFLLVTSGSSVFTGPQLTNLPKVVASIGEAKGEEVLSAINLDGGFASVFYTKGIHLRESNPIGSFFCLQ